MSESIELGGAVAPELRKIVTAGFLRRAVGAIIDGLVLAPILVALFAIPRGPQVALPDPWKLELFFACTLGYGTLMLGRYGWTVGMRAMKVRVAQADGGPINYGTAAVRTFAYWLPPIMSALPWTLRQGFGPPSSLVRNVSPCFGS